MIVTLRPRARVSACVDAMKISCVCVRENEVQKHNGPPNQGSCKSGEPPQTHHACMRKGPLCGKSSSCCPPTRDEVARAGVRVGRCDRVKAAESPKLYVPSIVQIEAQTLPHKSHICRYTAIRSHIASLIASRPPHPRPGRAPDKNIHDSHAMKKRRNAGPAGRGMRWGTGGGHRTLRRPPHRHTHTHDVRPAPAGRAALVRWCRQHALARAPISTPVRHSPPPPLPSPIPPRSQPSAPGPSVKHMPMPMRLKTRGRCGRARCCCAPWRWRR